MKHQSLRTAFWLGCCLCFLLVCAPLRAATPQVPAVLNSPQLSLLPYLDAYLDTTGEMDVEEVAAPANAPAFHPLDVKHLPHATGTTWPHRGRTARPFCWTWAKAFPVGRPCSAPGWTA